MKSLTKNIRFYVLAFSFMLSNFIFLYITTTIPSGNLQIIRITQTYALIALLLLYIALLIGPACYTFKKLPWKAKIIKSRRAIGVSAFYFALLHASFAFFGLLGGFSGLAFLDNTYLFSISLSFISLLILFLMSITSFDKIIRKMTVKKWKLLHRLIYLSGILLLIHAFLLGSHFSSLSGRIPVIAFLLLSFLLILEAKRIDHAITIRFPKGVFGPTQSLALSLILIYLFFAFDKQVPFPTTFNIHEAHQQIALDNLSNQNLKNSIPALAGDKNKKYNVLFKSPDNISANENTPLSFEIYDSLTGEKTSTFLKVYEKPMHLIMLNNSLTIFRHIHPDQSSNIFSITTSFPTDDKYHLYISYQPTGAIEQQSAFTLRIGDKKPSLSSKKIDKNLTKYIDNYEVTLKFENPLTADELTKGNKTLTFEIRDKKSHKLITDLMPYLTSFGHLTMINTETFEYTHVHPTVLAKKDSPSNGRVDFIPIGLFTPIKPGIYKLFAEFNPHNKLILVEYTIEIQ